MELVRLENVHKTYRLGEIDVPVLRGVSLSIERGELVALMGASGSGKTTLMNLLGCLDRPTSGRYWIDGREMSKASPNQRAAVRNSKIGFVFQSFNLLPRTSALENVLMPLEYSNVSASKGRQRAVELLTRLGLADRTRNEPSQLSGGQQQRVAIARSLINNPSLLLADEPTGALDSKTGEETLQLFQQLNREEGITIVLVTHDAHVAGHADRIIHIRDGVLEHDADESQLAAAGARGGNSP
jgi:ABC-type lipoprotein export system ATPase subunit